MAVVERATELLARQLQGYGTGPEVFGLIHADLRLANLMVADSGLWAIDFDDCGFGWWVYDLAAALSFIETDPRLPELIARWCEGYARVASLRAGDRSMIPAMILLRRVLLTAWLASRADSDTAATLGGAGLYGGDGGSGRRLPDQRSCRPDARKLTFSPSREATAPARSSRRLPAPAGVARHRAGRSPTG